MSYKKETLPIHNTEKQGLIPAYTSSRRSTMLELLARQTAKPKLRTPYPSVSKKPPAHYKFYYDSTLNGWKEKQKDTALSRWNKAKGALRVGNFFVAVKRTPGTVLNIDVKSLVKATTNKKMEPSDPPTHIEIDEDTKTALIESRTICKPFNRPDTSYNGVWMTPQSARPRIEKNKEFDWEKPKTERRNLVESASKYQAEYLKKVIKEKEKEIKLIVNQLIKCNRENVRLMKELDGYRGKNYDELYKENIVLKDQIARACRKNVSMAGQIRKQGNIALQNRPKTAA